VFRGTGGEFAGRNSLAVSFKRGLDGNRSEPQPRPLSRTGHGGPSESERRAEPVPLVEGWDDNVCDGDLCCHDCKLFADSLRFGNNYMGCTRRSARSSNR